MCILRAQGSGQELGTSLMMGMRVPTSSKDNYVHFKSTENSEQV